MNLYFNSDVGRGSRTVDVAAGFGLLMLTLSGFRAEAVSVGVAPPPPTSEDGNTYDLYVGGQEQYDSNLYRLPPGANNVATLVSPNASRADELSVISAGGDAQWSVGRQLVDVDLHVDTTRFAHNSTLNNTGGYGKLLWNWEFGPYFSGTAGANWSRSLSSFGEALYLGRDLVDSPDYYATGRYQVGPHWAVYGTVNDSSISHSLAVARTQDFRTEAGSGGIEYAVDPADTFSVEYRYDTGKFPNGIEVLTGTGVSLSHDVPGVVFSPDYHEDTYLFLLKHSFSDKTQLTADAGYFKRSYSDKLIASFSGDVWRVALNWQPTDKTQVVFAGWHELHAYLVAESNYFVSQGGSITPGWNATDKLSVSMVLSYEHQNFIPSSTSVVDVGPLKSNLATEQANINYSPRSNLTLTLSYIHTSRESNAQYFRFEDDRANFTVLYKIH